MILCQEGYRPGSKITNGLASGLIDGVIVSPRYHDPTEIVRYISELRQLDEGAYLLLDPEFQLGVVDGDKVGKLAEYTHYHDSLDWRSFTPGRVSRYVEEVFTLQEGLPLSRVLSPGITIRALSDWHGASALSLFDESIAQLGQPESRDRLLLTLALGDELFRNEDDLDDLLNELTILDCRGFYISVDRQNTNDTLWCGAGQDIALGNFLYLVHSLAMNGFEVICAYTDFTGVLALGAGASGVASGWFKKQRLFDSGRFTPTPPGGRAPKSYYASLPILNWIALSPDMDILSKAGVREAVLSGTQYDSILTDTKRDENWTPEVSVHAFWASLKKVDELLAAASSDARLNYLQEAIENAQRSWDDIRKATRSGAALTTTSTNIPCWRAANAHLLRRLSG